MQVLFAAFLVPALVVALSAPGGSTAGRAFAAEVGAAEIGVAVAAPVFDLPESHPVRGLADRLRELAQKAVGGGCRPLVAAFDGIEEIGAALKLRLAAGKPAPQGTLSPKGGARDLVVFTVAYANKARPIKGYRVAMAAVDLKTGRPREVAHSGARHVRDLPRAITAAGLALKPAFPCPRWRGEVIVSGKETSAATAPGVRRKGVIEWTMIVRLDGDSQLVGGRYALSIESRRCSGAPPRRTCRTRRLEGHGRVRAAAGARSRLEFLPGGRFRIVVGPAVAQVAMRTTTCVDGGRKCRKRRFRSEVALDGARAEGRRYGARPTLVGADVAIDTGSRKTTISWSFRASLD